MNCAIGTISLPRMWGGRDPLCIRCVKIVPADSFCGSYGRRARGFRLGTHGHFNGQVKQSYEFMMAFLPMSDLQSKINI